MFIGQRWLVVPLATEKLSTAFLFRVSAINYENFSRTASLRCLLHSMMAGGTRCSLIKFILNARCAMSVARCALMFMYAHTVNAFCVSSVSSNLFHHGFLELFLPGLVWSALQRRKEHLFCTDHKPRHRETGKVCWFLKVQWEFFASACR